MNAECLGLEIRQALLSDVPQAVALDHAAFEALGIVDSHETIRASRQGCKIALLETTNASALRAEE